MLPPEKGTPLTSAQKGEWNALKEEFDTDVWPQMQHIEGFFSAHSALPLWIAAKHCGEGAEFVEIGCFCGRSTAILGLAAKQNRCQLTTIDSFAFRIGLWNILPNLHRLKIEFALMVMESGRAASLFDRPIDLLFVDGGHHQIEDDCVRWLPKVKEGGLAIFHDYGPGWPSIISAVDQYTMDGYEDHGLFGGLAIKRKVNDSDEDSYSVYIE